MESKNALVLGLVLLVILIGYTVYQRGGFNFSGSTSEKSQEPETLPDDVLILNNAPTQNSTPEEARTHAELVSKLAEKAALLDITGCKANPVVMKTVVNDVIRVQNNDEVPHVLSVDEKHTYRLEGGGSKTITLDFAKRAGAYYGYGCDGSLKPIGFFYVTP